MGIHIIIYDAKNIFSILKYLIKTPLCINKKIIILYTPKHIFHM
jgi:hypothetical protein